MLDPDISAVDALALLSVRDNDPTGYSRRRFLQMVGWGVGGGALLGGLGASLLPELIPSEFREAWAAGPLGPSENILVLVGMYGGNDGLNTVVPYGNPLYYQYRSNISIPAAQLLHLDANLGLHPNLNYVPRRLPGTSGCSLVMPRTWHS